MNKFNYNFFLKYNNKKQQEELIKINNELNKLTVYERIKWALKNLPEVKILTTSFGIQSMVCIHLMITQKKNIPIIFVDTGYLFNETYLFINNILKKMKLNLNIFKAKKTSAWQEAEIGRLWEQGIIGIEFYNIINKVQPINKAFKIFNVKTWFTGIRLNQSKERIKKKILNYENNIFKFLPIIDWNNYNIYKYIKENNLSYHPLWEKGYLTVGDYHSTNTWKKYMLEENTRYKNIKRECGLHEIN